jgi:hypothetical protein
VVNVDSIHFDSHAEISDYVMNFANSCKSTISAHCDRYLSPFLLAKYTQRCLDFCTSKHREVYRRTLRDLMRTSFTIRRCTDWSKRKQIIGHGSSYPICNRRPATTGGTAIETVGIERGVAEDGRDDEDEERGEWQGSRIPKRKAPRQGSVGRPCT